MLVALGFHNCRQLLAQKVQADRNSMDEMNRKWAHLFVLLGFLTFIVATFHL